MKQTSFVISMLLGASSAATIKQHFAVAPETPVCTNANKATTTDQDCSAAGNSAWNTISTARTAKPKDAQAPPYPDHAEHVQYGSYAQSQFDGGSHNDWFPSYVPTNNAYPKVYDARAKTAPAVETQTPPTGDAPEAVGWYKPAWYKSGSSTSFGNLAQNRFDGGSHNDWFPSYVPTNNAYPKVYDARAKTAPAVETQTPPTGDAPEAVGWYKPAWYKSGSSTSFGNLAQSQFDSGSSRDWYPSYVPTNDAYPKIYDARAKTAPAVETQTPPTGDAPEAVGWYKPAWHKSGSSVSFGNLVQLDSEDIVGTGFKGALDFKVSPATNACTNANKATTDDEDCSTDGNSAWNTITSSRTAKPKNAQAAPYPGHTEH